MRLQLLGVVPGSEFVASLDPGCREVPEKPCWRVPGCLDVAGINQLREQPVDLLVALVACVLQAQLDDTNQSFINILVHFEEARRKSGER